MSSGTNPPLTLMNLCLRPLLKPQLHVLNQGIQWAKNPWLLTWFIPSLAVTSTLTYTDSLTYSFKHSFTHWLIHSSTHSLTDSFNIFVHLLIQSHLFTCAIISSPTHTLAHSLFCSFFLSPSLPLNVSLSWSDVPSVFISPPSLTLSQMNRYNLLQMAWLKPSCCSQRLRIVWPPPFLLLCNSLSFFASATPAYGCSR